jgi:hypothetical protein
MAIGKRKSTGNFLPVLKWDAKAGTFYLQDRVYAGGCWETEQRDVTPEFRAAIDVANLQLGWIKFPKASAPQTQLKPFGQDYGDPPDADYREGLRVLVKMDQSLGGDVRELLSTAAALWNAMDKLHDAYLAGVTEHPGALPVCDLASVTETKNASGSAFEPVFKIVGWLPRPPDLPLVETARPAAPPKPKAGKAAGADMDDAIPF